jgi:proteic killer suppression protein
MIKTFANKETAAVFANHKVRRFDINLLQIAQRKLAQLHRVQQVDELQIPPGNRLEKLSGKRAGQWSMRINNRWRICFVWRDGHAWDVEIVDYH